MCGPAVKLSIAGTRPAACSAMKVTAAPLALGSRTPTTSPGAEIVGDLAREHADADAKHAQGQRAAERVLDRDAPEAALLRRLLERRVQRAANVGRLEDEVRHHVAERGAGGAPPRPAAQGRPASRAGRGGRIVTVTFGKSRRPTWLGVEAREKVRSGPTRRTGVTSASLFSIISAAAVIGFHQGGR